MDNKIKIAPSVLAADFTQLGNQVKEAEEHGADQIHIDVMDGRFVPNISMGPMVVEAIRRVTDLPLDVHLMIVEPEQHLETFAKAGASALTVHLEACTHLHRTLQYIQDLGLQAGVAINPHTPISLLSEVIDLADIILVMTVNPGFGGQKFITDVMPKLTKLRAQIRSKKVDITVDGGIDPTTTPQVLKAGANVLVAGTAIFGHKDGVTAGIETMKTAVQDYISQSQRIV